MKSVFSLTISFSVLATAFAGKKAVCYYSSQAVYYGGDGAVQPEQLDPFLCTHIVYSFVSVGESGLLSPMDGHVDIDKGGYNRTVFLKNINKDLKIMLSVGGTEVPASRFSKIAGDPTLVSAMVGSAREYMKKYGFDGVDIHWKYPTKEDKDNFVNLLRAFKDDFVKDGWLVSAAVAHNLGDEYDAPKITEFTDFVVLMTYDMYTPTTSNYTGHNSPMHPSVVESLWEKNNLNVEYNLLQWKEAGADVGKLLLGIATYGHTYTLANQNDKYKHSPFTGPGPAGPILHKEGTLSFLEICERMAEDRYYWSCDWDNEQDVPFCKNNYGHWLSYDSENSVHSKGFVISKQDLGGGAVWTVDQDDVHGRCGESNPILKALVVYQE